MIINGAMFSRIHKIIIIFLFFAFSFIALGAGLAGAKGEAVEEPKVTNVNSYELFWPLVAGKTKGESLYSLKLFKEKARGALIFGAFKKVDYEVFLATKRVIEAEKLLNSGKQDLANESLNLAAVHLENAQKKMEDMGNEYKVKAKVDEVNNKLNNLETFLSWLTPQYEVSSDEIKEVLVRVQDLNQKI
ncbi:MAG: hypothetical protein UV74_C0013G0355 [Candidatus Woesebacteria bacterium GW2011_GWB1_43_14]|uniref:DUF5667 domain-containing protein n=1 Tax=Candidatus Woesebacteria bacterium GW2011_GWB1_43_14 TaxID=1618578 RepID=A0A0G1GEE1_9BACT|nr:MAG: hypothetical protein UT21_C0001G0065 [Candidatus Woesebacteria bacterium GW2011_GWA1_39_11b]KKS78349.1 MAG: hypothetical protein UV51_C0001G0065 [Candidatus Woesebacteria bacterium GW2011_GWC1_42_9]KKS97233.1 MAG: hypothetical protein UV74_C0013G0355 [Candidatus Woesebacteria bacterium GW2011_GWB1_43_14]